MTPQKVSDILIHIIDGDWRIDAADTFEALKYAAKVVDKEIPKTPYVLFFENRDQSQTFDVCPVCGSPDIDKECGNYCPKCGQKIDWEGKKMIEYDVNEFFDRKNKMVADIIGGDTAKADAGKPRLSLVPRKIIWDIAAIREYGNKKYGDPNNWRKVEPERYRDAAYRHFMRYLDDPTGVDEESGLPHLWHLATNISFLCELEDIKNEIH